MPRYINADALRDTIHAHHYVLCDAFNSTDYGMWTIGIYQAIDEQPTADVQEVKHGHWITRNEGNPFLIYGECSVCEFGQSLSAYLNFCPNCGAKMDGGCDEECNVKTERGEIIK